MLSRGLDWRLDGLRGGVWACRGQLVDGARCVQALGPDGTALPGDARAIAGTVRHQPTTWRSAVSQRSCSRTRSSLIRYRRSTPSVEAVFVTTAFTITSTCAESLSFETTAASFTSPLEVALLVATSVFTASIPDRNSCLNCPVESSSTRFESASQVW